ncbi:ABC transporter permease [Fundidesulfovibrio putealis]|uniref:ABC transporter permease n=1 Tax=Fundidesulfovibrio putealis TaxID=270496 RepID=UPI00040100FA|nr:ABC transporter permease [Fundidesulfovibrio putealis]
MPLSRKQMEALSPWLVTLGLFILWELIARVGKIPSYILPTPSQSIIEGWEYKGPIMQHALQTLYTTSAGFALAVVFGMLLGVLVGSSKVVYKALYPVLVGFNSVPKVALVPILVIWFGIGSVPAIITAFLISFFPVVVNVATGLATLEPELEDVLRVLGATKVDVLMKVGIPRSLPFFFASLKIAVTLAFVGSVISETVASNSGIGYLMMSASSKFNVPLVFAGLMVIAAMGVGMYEFFAMLERRFTAWAHRG